MIEIQFFYTDINGEITAYEFSYNKKFLEEHDIDYHKMNMKDKEKLEKELCSMVDDCYELTGWKWILCS